MKSCYQIQQARLHVLFLALLIPLLSGCARASLTDDGGINQQEAIEIAVEIASMSIPEISGSQVAPSNIQADKLTLEEAAEHINANRQDVFSENPPDLPVWRVTMDGIWLPPDVPDVPTLKPYRHLCLILDAETGNEILRSMQP
ncbi:MAG TPA: hypothetical protein VFY66_08680 [Anaerolineales bacterium]|nr:hypothetical protein [Anaerolineales bacterium]